MSAQRLPCRVETRDFNMLSECNHALFTNNRIIRRCSRVHLSGLVQGVGFRPYVARLARRLALSGWIANTSQGVTIEVEGQRQSVEQFLAEFDQCLPALARIDTVSVHNIDWQNHDGFQIRESYESTANHALITPDAATCRQCLSDIADRSNRRYQYPFTCCTECGPRYSVVQALPYDRANTTMQKFIQCAVCQAEYDSPYDRRYHAQANACPECGPLLYLVDSQSEVLSEGHDAVICAAAALQQGQIVGLKGLGGFQLLVDARNQNSIKRLRRLKQRPEKPFAIMAPELEFIKSWCEVSVIEQSLLESAQAPIVLLQRKVRGQQILPAGEGIADNVARDSCLMGCMLANTPLHHLLMQEFNYPVVVTSGNLSDQPLAYDDFALETIGTLADVFLTHNRTIACSLDDSVVRVVADRPLLIRCGRGYAPVTLPISEGVDTSISNSSPVLALGGHLKSSVATVSNQCLTTGPYRGDLNSVETRLAFNENLAKFKALHATDPIAIACDEHPDYYTTSEAHRLSSSVIQVQHHLAHIVSCMSDNTLQGPVLGVAWDGTGYGPGDVIGGGEFIVVDDTQSVEVAQLRPFRLPGAERAIVEPRRAAFGLLFELFGKPVFENSRLIDSLEFSSTELGLLKTMLLGHINAPQTSSVGRFFDALASLLGLHQCASFEGQAAMAVEQLANQASNTRSDTNTHCVRDTRYCLFHVPAQNAEVSVSTDESTTQACLDWSPTIRAVLTDLNNDVDVATIAWQVHSALADVIVSVARDVNLHRVVLSGGCFQNRLLTEISVSRLRAAGYEPYWHKSLPANDGSLAAGQAMWAQRLLNREQPSCV